MIRALSKFSYRLFGNTVHKYRDHFSTLAEELRKARLGMPLEEYVSFAILLSIIVFVVSFVLSYALFALLYNYATALTVLSTIIVSVSAAVLLFLFLLNYPAIRARKRAEDIDAHLPHAVIHMATIAGTGTPPITIFRAIMNMKEYGEISSECAMIVRDVEALGRDLFTALAEAARRSPSKHWAELLWGIITTLRTGGNLRQYLSDKAEEYVRVAEYQEKRAMETLSLLSEVYMVVFILAPILAVIMVALMGFFGGYTLGLPPNVLLAALVYFILPVVGVVFVLLVSSGMPREVF